MHDVPIAAIEPYPWHDELLQCFATRRHHLPQAVLLAGKRYIGQDRIACAMIALLVCAAPCGHRACGQCPFCIWLKEGTHPDVHWLVPGGTRSAESRPSVGHSSASITVEQVRELTAAIHFTTHQGLGHFVVITVADAMTVSGSNALLKSLEEPAGPVLFFLITTHPNRLLPTIRSRCQDVIVCPTPTRSVVVDWLQTQQDKTKDFGFLLSFTGMQPLLALDFIRHGFDGRCADFVTRLLKRISPILVCDALEDCVGRMSKIWPECVALEHVLDGLLYCLMDMVTLKSDDKTIGIRQDLAWLWEYGCSFELNQISVIVHHLITLKRLVTASVNRRLFIEQIVFSFY